jgi:hypothetical protein|tara:strand:+ start:2376 stop:3254 length:879 start_codon:yes stop_codon:yes gene_type:complete
MPKALIIGMGIGQLYYQIYMKKGWEFQTVDLTKPADYSDVIDIQGEFDIAHICTPNFTHESIARQIADKCKIVFVEKPGAENADAWSQLVKDFPQTLILMVKNNQHRHNVDILKETTQNCDNLVLNWCNKNRVPNPGSWFTTKELAYGGVSRDLMPHLLSWVQVLADDYTRIENVYNDSEQRYDLDTIGDTDYGEVTKNGTYDVDDFAQIYLVDRPKINFMLNTAWKQEEDDAINIKFYSMENLIHTEELGLCPEDAYSKMIDSAYENIYNKEYKQEQLAKDIWIHKQLERL